MGGGELMQRKHAVAAPVHSTPGVSIMTISISRSDVLTPEGAIWKEPFEGQNVAVAIFLSATAHGIAAIVAPAIHG